MYDPVCVCVRACVCAYRLVEVVSHRVSQGADGIVQDEQVLVLVLVEGEDQRVQDVGQVGDQLGTRLLLQGSKRTTGGTGKGGIQWWRGGVSDKRGRL